MLLVSTPLLELQVPFCRRKGTNGEDAFHPRPPYQRGVRATSVSDCGVVGTASDFFEVV